MIAAFVALVLLQYFPTFYLIFKKEMKKGTTGRQEPVPPILEKLPQSATFMVQLILFSVPSPALAEGYCSQAVRLM
jgi:hypothetical protein